MSEIIFEVRQDEADGGYTASALGFGIHTQAETREELRAMASVIRLNPAIRDRVKSGHRGGRRHDCFTLHRCVSARIRFC